LERKQVNGLQLYQSERWQDVKHGIFTRHGGVSMAPWASLNTGGTVGDDVEHVRQNHRLMYAALGVRAESACTTWLIHSADVVVADAPVENRRWLARADGIMTNRADLPLVMRYADCVPLLYRDPVQNVIGLAHAGWRGTVQGMASNMVRAMNQAYGCQPHDIEVIIGPSISIQHFQVGEEVVEALQQYFGSTDGMLTRDSSDGTAYVDLWEANRRDLERAGVEQVEIAGICTYANHHDFFSHRADHGKTGRFGVVLSL
jgi:polyphenol oxidase